MKFASDGRLIASDTTGLRIWDLQKRTSKLIYPSKNKTQMMIAVGAVGNRILLTDIDGKIPHALDLKQNKTWPIASHRNRVSTGALDLNGNIAVTGDSEGVVRVGPLTGEEPHLLFEHTQRISSCLAQMLRITFLENWLRSESGNLGRKTMSISMHGSFHSIPHKGS